MVSRWQARVEKAEDIVVFYRFNTSSIRQELVKIRKIDKEVKFKDVMYTIFTDLAFKMARNVFDGEHISSISIINTRPEKQVDEIHEQQI